jgi:predicted 2-oxoglutarate/Fe(II)-dependent dioxygenase YbiX/peroxiredoxin
MLDYVQLLAGDPAPWFQQRSFANPRYTFHTAAGRYIVLCFFGSAVDDHSRSAIRAMQSRPSFFDDTTACFFGVSHDPSDESAQRVKDQYPGYRYFWDFDGAIGKQYGSLPAHTAGLQPYVRRLWVVLDPSLRVMTTVDFAPDRSDIAKVLNFIDQLPPVNRFAGVELQAPILFLPKVFEPEFCQQLIALYEADGGEESGFMREVDGRTVTVQDHQHKRRRDYTLQEIDLINACNLRVMRRIVPMIYRAHAFTVTRMERYIVGCYDAKDQAHFRPHRDNTTKGTAHRRFAVSINLNDDFEGGEIGFPEYGHRRYKPPIGGAVVFSCSLLHAVSEVTRGRRFAFLPFLYDDAAALIREQNISFLEDGTGHYQSGLG